MSFFYPLVADVQLAGKALIIPVVSTANVSQLAVDLLIASLSLVRLGVLDAKDLVPVVSGREDGEEGITTPLELYGRSDLEIIVIQQRSPSLKSRKQQFVDSLLEFISDSNISSVLFLSGVELSNRTDSQMSTPIYYIHPPNSPSLASGPLVKLTQLHIPTYASPLPSRTQHSGDDGVIPFIPGGGLTRRFLASLPPSWKIPTASLLQFAIEGDNRADAALLATVVSRLVGTDALIKEWKQPSSWQEGLFGTPHDQALYG